MQRLQVALGKLRRTLGHFAGHVLAIDPHRVRSYSKRQKRRHPGDRHARPMKMSPTFFVLDTDTHQPVCFTTATSARSVTAASIELLGLAAEILDPQPFTPHWAGYATHADQLRRHYQGLAGRPVSEGVNPRIPWLYDFKLDFRFR